MYGLFAIYFPVLFLFFFFVFLIHHWRRVLAKRVTDEQSLETRFGKTRHR